MEMARTYIFNPEHDLALAHGGERYTPSLLVRRLRRDLQLLPAWYAPPGSEVVSDDAQAAARWIEKCRLNVRPIEMRRLQNRHSSYHPWGWDHDVRRRLLHECVPAADLPTAQQVEKLRSLSHRRISIDIMRRLGPIAGLSPIPEEVASVTQAARFAMLHPGCYLKAPWSGSGKGIFRVHDPAGRNFATWAQGVLDRQGSILCEVPLRGVLDFAMEFRCDGGQARFTGYSVFSNDGQCSYDHGIVAQQATLEAIIASHGASRQRLAALKGALEEILTTLVAPHYDGPMGIDMMVYDGDDGTRHIAPCIELNLRMTMGIVAHKIAQSHLHPGSQGTFHVTYSKSPEELKKLASTPPLLIDGRLAAGVLPLTPIHAETCFMAYVAAIGGGELLH